MKLSSTVFQTEAVSMKYYELILSKQLFEGIKKSVSNEVLQDCLDNSVIQESYDDVHSSRKDSDTTEIIEFQ